MPRKAQCYVSRASLRTYEGHALCLAPRCGQFAGRVSAFCDGHFLLASSQHRAALVAAPSPSIDANGMWSWFSKKDRLRWTIAARDVWNDVTGSRETPAADRFGRDASAWSSTLDAPDECTLAPSIQAKRAM